MKAYVTYADLFGGGDTTSPYFLPETPFIKGLQGITGAWQAYGLFTPIYMTDILSTLGVNAFMQVLPYATDVSATMLQSCAIDLIKQFAHVWKEQMNNSDRLDRLMILCESLLTATQPTELRLDNCGDPIGAGGILDANLVITMAEEIKASTDALPSPPTFQYAFHQWYPVTPPQHWIYVGMEQYVDNPIPPPFGTTIDWTLPVNPNLLNLSNVSPSDFILYVQDAHTDPDTPLHLWSPHWFSTVNIADIMQQNPDYFLLSVQQYSSWEALNGFAMGWVRWVHFVGGTLTYSPLISAAQGIANAALATTQLITEDAGGFINVIYNIISAIDDWNTGSKLLICDKVNRYTELTRNWLNQACTTTFYPICPENPQWYNEEKAIFDDYKALIAAKLRDRNWVERNTIRISNAINGDFPQTDGSTAVTGSPQAVSICTEDGLIALFMNARMQAFNAVVYPRAKALLDTLNNQRYTGFPDPRDLLKSLLRPYFL